MLQWFRGRGIFTWEVKEKGSEGGEILDVDSQCAGVIFGVTEQGLTGRGRLSVIARLVKHMGLGAVGEAGQGEAA